MPMEERLEPNREGTLVRDYFSISGKRWREQTHLALDTQCPALRLKTNNPRMSRKWKNGELNEY